MFRLCCECSKANALREPVVTNGLHRILNTLIGALDDRAARTRFDRSLQLTLIMYCDTQVIEQQLRDLNNGVWWR